MDDYAIRSEREYSDGRLDGGQRSLAAIPGVPGLDGRFDHAAAPSNIHGVVIGVLNTRGMYGCPGHRCCHHFGTAVRHSLKRSKAEAGGALATVDAVARVQCWFQLFAGPVIHVYDRRAEPPKNLTAAIHLT